MDSDFGIARELSDLQKLRSQYQPELPPCLQGTTVRVEFGDATTAADSFGAHTISRSFPHTYGQPLAHFLRATAKVPDAQIITEHPAIRYGTTVRVEFGDATTAADSFGAHTISRSFPHTYGQPLAHFLRATAKVPDAQIITEHPAIRQSPGGHNVIWGLHNALKIHNPNSSLLGFLGGSEGIFAQKTLEITDDILATYKNQGSYDLLVVGIPVTLNGDLKNQFVETNVGFDTICKVNSQLISNVCTDALSAEKYYYFVRLMGRKASHVALECTLQSHPNMVILGEEVAASKLTLFDLTKQICDAVQARAEQDKYHGVILLPEGLIESIPEVYALLQHIMPNLSLMISKRSLLCLLPGGSEGIFAQKTLEITDDILATYKNQGGYDLLGRTKDQIRTTEQVNAALNTCRDLKLDGLVIVGGVTSNTDAAQLAETFAEAKWPTKVVGIPVTLNGDLKNQFVETNVGFDTICKVNSQLISNVCTDALSAEKVILGEEVAASKLTLFDLTKQICDAVQARAEQDKYHGVILLPEGLIESIPEVYALLQEIHGLLRQGVSVDGISTQLSPWASALFEFLPPFIRKQLLLHPESDDSAQLSQIETEKLLAHLVEAEMNKRLKEGTYKGKKFNAICHFFGYQARGSLPSKFDCDYAYVLGHICYHILAAGLNGYMATVTNLKNPLNKWRCGAAPITAMMTVKRYGRGPGALPIGKPAVHPATVDLTGKAYELLRQNATKFLMDDVYRNPGPLQFDGTGADAKAVTLCVEDQDYMGRIKALQEYLNKVRMIVKPGCSQDVLKAALSAMTAVTDILLTMTSPSNVLCKTEKAYKAHVVVLAYHGQGHINPIVQFSKRLASKGIKVTVTTKLSTTKTMQATAGSIIFKRL
ncbi:unnamed protein product [Ilex paraguariensis]|uniref:Phosphofructokinase domain-containing protein n=1 Tax=Ilex paraguariensis TaxID=185542 RepID=A0ABC8SHT7_9AQUA